MEQIFYRGFEINRKGTLYEIKGSALVFYTLQAAKDHINWIKSKPNFTTPFHL